MISQHQAASHKRLEIAFRDMAPETAMNWIYQIVADDPRLSHEDIRRLAQKLDRHADAKERESR